MVLLVKGMFGGATSLRSFFIGCPLGISPTAREKNTLKKKSNFSWPPYPFIAWGWSWRLIEGPYSHCPTVARFGQDLAYIPKWWFSGDLPTVDSIDSITWNPFLEVSFFTPCQEIACNFTKCHCPWPWSRGGSSSPSRQFSYFTCIENPWID